MRKFFSKYYGLLASLAFVFTIVTANSTCTVTANQTSGQKNEPRSTSAQIPYSVHHNELQ